MEELTKTEERVMQILWKLKRAFVKDVIEQLPDPKPPYNTISSVIRLLEQKGFIDHKAYGKTYEYFPIVSKLAYKKFAFKNFLQNYFEDSYENVVSYIVQEEDIDEDQIQKLREIIETKKEE
ncbi:BlaI/MecI/CopY family transcriptional regulator [Fulvivirgaceae bacterium BMA10]|uniref:BlaI/MecI/CopY family transcriptional regulator n=1 Tax=Splendidivirga corallicola TaxID=3051826 RepID=A0ABT8KXL6_9BACT|nr:BlaI/MecI/CopY family transcriptional regulator [Fulvivirgaceae bacterium BMA10]